MVDAVTSGSNVTAQGQQRESVGYVFPDGRSLPAEPLLKRAYLLHGPPRPSWINVWIAKPELLPLHLSWIFTLVLALFAIAAWRDAKTTADLLSTQAGAAQGSLALLQAEERPWVYVTATEKLTANLFRPAKATGVDQSDAVVSLDLPVSNSGKIPARFVRLEGNVLFRASSIIREADRQRGSLDIQSQSCEAAKLPKQVKGGTTVFPGQPAVLSGNFEMYPDEIKRWLKDFREADHDLIVTGCIDYIIGENIENHHQTKFAYTVSHSNDKKIDPADPSETAQIAFSGLKLSSITDATLDAN